MPTPTIDVLREKTEAIPIAGCWLWTSSLGRKGYGLVQDGRKPRSAHRRAYIYSHGPIPDGLFVLHRCDVPCCINPHHLFLGTQADNMADMRAKGRGKTGLHNKIKTHCKHGHALSDENVIRTPEGFRVCRRCANDRKRESFIRKAGRVPGAYVIRRIASGQPQALMGGMRGPRQALAAFARSRLSVRRASSDDIVRCISFGIEIEDATREPAAGEQEA